MSCTLIKLYIETGVRFVSYLSLAINAQSFEYVFISFKAKIDHNNHYLKIVNFNI